MDVATKRLLSSFESNSPEILALCETNLDDSPDSGNFSMRGYPPLIRKESITHMQGLAVYVKEGLNISRKICGFLLVFDWLYFAWCLTFFASIKHLLSLYAGFLILFHLT